MKKVLLLSVCLIASTLMGGGKLWADNVTFTESDDNGTLTITLTNTATDDNVTAVKTKMNSGSYTKVAVEGGTVTDAFIRGIIYPNGNANTTMTALDLSGTSYSSTTFEKTAFYEGEDYGWKVSQLTIKQLSLPANITTIAKEALTNLQNVEKVVFPENLDKICDGAFFNCYALKNIKFNSKLRYIGNSAFACDRAVSESTIIITKNVKYIGPAAFFGRQYQDVYFMGDRAPVMPNGKPVENISAGDKECTAFPSNTLMGNNGFNPSSNSQAGGTADNTSAGYANRENYYNGAYMIILHYPNSITSTDDLKTYFDTTRKYETKVSDDGTYSATATIKVGNETTTLSGYNVNAATDVTVGYKDTYVGDSYIWPSQSQWMRSYITAVNGVEWDGVTTYRTELTEDEKKVLEEAGYKVGATYTENNEEKTYTEDDLKRIAHLGTRMFVLANDDSRNSDQYPINIKGGKWWTLCVPFNMTKAQVEDVFGKGTNVCLFNKVDRTISPSGNKIHLYFTIDVCQFHKCTAKDASTGRWDYNTISNNTAPGDDDIVIYAHESYMIRPANTDEDAKFVVDLNKFDIVTGNPEPTVVTSQTTIVTQDDEEGMDYRFIGNYIGSDNSSSTAAQTVNIPQYSYVYASKKGDVDNDGNKIYKFWFITDGNMKWSANKSVVQTTDRDGGKEDNDNFFGGNPSGAKQASTFGAIEDNGTTSAGEMVIITGERADAPVYSLNGTLVSRNGSTSRLAKGIYIQNGKKFIVK